MARPGGIPWPYKSTVNPILTRLRKKFRDPTRPRDRVTQGRVRPTPGSWRCLSATSLPERAKLDTLPCSALKEWSPSISRGRIKILSHIKGGIPAVVCSVIVSIRVALCRVKSEVEAEATPGRRLNCHTTWMATSTEQYARALLLIEW